MACSCLKVAQRYLGICVAGEVGTGPSSALASHGAAGLAHGSVQSDNHVAGRFRSSHHKQQSGSWCQTPLRGVFMCGIPGQRNDVVTLGVCFCWSRLRREAPVRRSMHWCM